MSQGGISKDQAARLLRRVRERAEKTHEQVFVVELAPDCQLSTCGAETAWRYLRDLGLVQTFLIDYTAQINAKDINFLASATMNKAADGFVEAATAMGRGYGHVDSPEALALIQ
jgi:hypothetical protein